MAEHRAAVVLFEVLKVVAACHRRSVCHGDIKVQAFPDCASCRRLTCCCSLTNVPCIDMYHSCCCMTMTAHRRHFEATESASYYLQPANFLLAKPLEQPLHALAPGNRPQAGWLKAIDFGCAQQLVGNKPLTRRTGTPVYMVRISCWMIC